MHLMSYKKRMVLVCPFKQYQKAFLNILLKVMYNLGMSKMIFRCFTPVKFPVEEQAWFCPLESIPSQ